MPFLTPLAIRTASSLSPHLYSFRQSQMEVHRARFVDFIPSAINALAFAPNTARPVMACGRANGDIEVWNPKNEWTLEKVTHLFANAT